MSLADYCLCNARAVRPEFSTVSLCEIAGCIAKTGIEMPSTQREMNRCNSGREENFINATYGWFLVNFVLVSRQKHEPSMKSAILSDDPVS